jgi:hypothetical protein
MVKSFFICLVFFLHNPHPVFCQENEQADSNFTNHVFTSAKPKPFHFITNLPGNLIEIAKAPFKKEYLNGIIITSILTGLFISVDQPLLNAVHNIGKEINLDPETKYKVPIKIGEAKILKIPQNINTALYQIGEGGTSLLLAGGLFIYGKFNHSKREIEAASDLTETFITMGIATQILKRISGRESPFVATKSGGRWRPFPSFNAYQSHTPSYDAFPSGHLATLMATVTTLRLAYPEKKWITPVGYTVMGLSAFAMANTDVHWIGDYPLAVALGYVAARITHSKNHPSEKVQTDLKF